TNGEESEHTFDKKLPSGTTISVVAEDYAGNTTEYLISGVNDNTPPVISPTTPGTGEVFNTNEVQVTGTVSDNSKVVEFKVNGQDVELVWNKEKGNYSYDTTVTFDEDGSHIISLYAKDVAGNEASLSNSRFVIIDTTAPGLEADAPAVVNSDTTKVNLVAHLTDNFDEISYYVDGSEA
ncbi:Ig-like domain-containing protein, partial [Microvirga sp. 3-52]|nr:Ig-like domain-containing protein [Microvirga sp. 3-52]